LAFNRFPNQAQPAFSSTDPADAKSQQLQDLAWLLVGGVSTQFQAQFFNKSGVRQPTDNKEFRQHEYDGFVQDTWKLRENFTLNIGLRYQFDGVPFEEGGNFSNLFANPDTSLASYTLTVVGPALAGRCTTMIFRTLSRGLDSPGIRLRMARRQSGEATGSSMIGFSTTCSATRAPIHHFNRCFLTTSQAPPRRRLLPLERLNLARLHSRLEASRVP